MSATPTSLEEVIAPLTLDEFLGFLRRRELVYCSGGDECQFKSLLNWESLLERIRAGAYPRGFADFRIVKESKNISAAHWFIRTPVDDSTKVDIAKLEEFLASGYSLVITPIQPHVPVLAKLADNLAATLREQIKIGVVVTTGAGGAFKLHFDPEDLIILQVEGTKRWRIYGPVVANPVIGMPPPPAPPENDPIFDEILKPGDMLFLPAGYWHHCENGPGRSMHLGIFLIPPTYLHVAKALVSRLVSDEKFRLPLTRVVHASELEELETDLKDSLIQKIRELELRGFLAEADKKETDSISQA